jgi:hypothetical protein
VEPGTLFAFFLEHLLPCCHYPFFHRCEDERRGMMGKEKEEEWMEEEGLSLWDLQPAGMVPFSVLWKPFDLTLSH